MNTPQVSIIIPLYNKESAISSTIHSILKSSWTDFEIIVVDDGSTDNSVANISAINDTRIKIIKQQNSGPSAARNKGVKNASGEWIMFFDADDTIYPDGLERLLSATRKNDVDIVTGGLDCQYPNGSFTSPLHNNIERLIPEKDNYKYFFFHKIFPSVDSTIIRRSFLLNYLYKEDLRRYEDAELIVRWCESARIYKVKGSIAVYRKTFSNASKPKDDQFNFDYCSQLPFQNGTFWKNCYLGTLLRSAKKNYPNRVDQLKSIYGSFNVYAPLSFILWKIGRLIY